MRLGTLDPELAEALLRDERVVRDDAHLEPARAPRHLLADPAEPEHAERLAGELEAAVARALPAALLERRVRLRDVPREREQQPDRVLRGRDDRRLGRVGDDDAAPRRGVHVDVVDPDARAPDHLQPVGPLDQVRVELRRRADDDRVVVADLLGEVAVRVHVHVEPLAEELDPRRRRSARGRGRAAHAALVLVRLERARDGDAALDVGARLGERELDPGQRRRDVEDVEPADVADAEDLALERALARCERDARCGRAGRAGTALPSTASGTRTAVTTAELSSSGEKSSRPIAFTPSRQARPRRTWRSKAASRPLLEDQAERDVRAR